MSKQVFVLVAVVIAALSAFVGFQFFHYKNIEIENELIKTNERVIIEEPDLIGTTRPHFSLPDVNNKMRSINEWDGEVIVINFWATWCPPCREEIPEFIELQTSYAEQGLQFIGIALQKAEDVTEFIEELGVNYPILVGEEAVIQIAKSYGNQIGALPYTVIINRQSQIAFIKQGPLSRKAAERAITSLL